MGKTGIMNKQCAVIAEAGVNHNGDIALALELVDRAADAQADYVKFQTFRADELASRHAPKAAYQQCTTAAAESQRDMLRRLQLSEEQHHLLVQRCAEKGIAFLSSPFDLPSLQFLTAELGLATIKLGSGELTNAPLLLAAAQSGASIMLSTGMGTMGEVEEALGVIAYGLSGGNTPCRAAFAAILHDRNIWSLLRQRVTLLHCTTEYPAPVPDTNLRAMDSLRSAFTLPVGYSDHTPGNIISFAAVARGAEVIEKHFTLDRTMPGPDHRASLEPAELVDLVRGIRDIEQALGNGVKQPGASELANRPVARKSLFAAQDLPAGHRLSAGDIKVKRPGDGISAMDYWDVLGSRLRDDLAGDMPLARHLIEPARTDG